MLRQLLFCLLIGLACASPATSQGGTGTPVPRAEQDLSALLREVREKEDKVDRRIFGRIASLGTEESLRGLSGLVNSLRSETVLGSAYGAFLLYKGKDALEKKSIKFLHLHSQKHRRPANKRAAARALVRFGDASLRELESLFRTQLKREEDVARIAFQPLIPVFGERGGPKEAELIVTHGDLRSTAQVNAIRAALENCTSESSTKILCNRLNQDDTPLVWKNLLLDILAGRAGSSVERAFVFALDDPAASVRARAITLLGLRGDAAYTAKLEKHLDAQDSAELRAAVLALCRLNRNDPRWVRELMDMAKSSRWEERMSAAVGLLEVRTPEAVSRLHELLRDTDWHVRFEAMQQVGTLRRNTSVPILIERLDRETRRLREDLALVLRLMTGLDHGSTSTRWGHWWADQGDTFVLPTYETALAAEKTRQERKKESVTQVTFYGLGIISDRLAFVVDISGSMSAMAKWKDDRSTTEGNTSMTRLAIAKKELSRALKGLSPGTLFNLIFFSSGVSAWQDELIPMDEEVLAEALQFTNRHGAGGGTNVYGGLMAVFDDPEVDTLYLLSDGDPSVGEFIDTAMIHDRIIRLNETRNIRINCISIGKSSPFMKRLAEATGGAYVEFL